MVKKCCIKTCRSESYGGCGISFHSFPKNLKIKNMWLDIVAMPQRITKNSVVCSLHFKQENFYYANSRQLLKPDAIPSILPMKDEQISVPSNIVDQLPLQPIIDLTSVVSQASNLEIKSSTPETSTSDQLPAMKLCSSVKEVAVQTEIRCNIHSQDMLRRKVKVLSQRLMRRDNKIKQLKSFITYLKKREAIMMRLNIL